MTSADGDRGGAGALDLEGSGHWLTSEGGLRCDSGLAVEVDEGGTCSSCDGGATLTPTRGARAQVDQINAARRRPHRKHDRHRGG